MRHTSALTLYARRPCRGFVKTRLAPLLGVDGALELHRAMLLDGLALLRRTCGGSIAPVVALGDPGGSLTGEIDPELEAALSGLFLLPQRGDDLGERLQATFRSLFARGFRIVVIFGSDSPTLPPDRLSQAFARLEAGTDVVIGPAEDGGYYLIGARRLPTGIFTNIPWGGAGVMRATRAALRRSGAAWSLLDSWYDVDRPDDLDRVRLDLAGPSGSAAPRTARFCASLPSPDPGPT